jgi:hypothetical protein
VREKSIRRQIESVETLRQKRRGAKVAEKRQGKQVWDNARPPDTAPGTPGRDSGKMRPNALFGDQSHSLRRSAFSASLRLFRERNCTNSAEPLFEKSPGPRRPGCGMRPGRNLQRQSPVEVLDLPGGFAQFFRHGKNTIHDVAARDHRTGFPVA